MLLSCAVWAKRSSVSESVSSSISNISCKSSSSSKGWTGSSERWLVSIGSSVSVFFSIVSTSSIGWFFSIFALPTQLSCLCDWVTRELLLRLGLGLFDAGRLGDLWAVFSLRKIIKNRAAIKTIRTRAIMIFKLIKDSLPYKGLC